MSHISLRRARTEIKINSAMQSTFYLQRIKDLINLIHLTLHSSVNKEMQYACFAYNMYVKVCMSGISYGVDPPRAVVSNSMQNVSV